MDFRDELKRLPVEKKARRLRLLWPTIEAKLAEGVSHAAVLDFLNRNSFGFTEGTYKNYVHRMRQKQRTTRSAGTTATAPTHSPFAMPITGATGEPGKRPPTFDYDPTGGRIADLLK